MIDVFAGGIASRNHFKDKKDLAVIDAAVRKHGSNPYTAHWSIMTFCGRRHIYKTVGCAAQSCSLLRKKRKTEKTKRGTSLAIRRLLFRFAIPAQYKPKQASNIASDINRFLLRFELD